MLLVDSSVWIDTLRAVQSDATRFVAGRDEHDELATTGRLPWRPRRPG